MFKKCFLRCAVALLFMVSIAGCGSDSNSNTNGSLTLVAPVTIGAGIAVMNATATLVPNSVVSGVTPGLAGAEVTFTVSQFGYNPGISGIEVLESYTETAFTNNVGVARISHNFSQSLVMATTIQVTAKCQGLVSETVSNPVPKFVP